AFATIKEGRISHFYTYAALDAIDPNAPDHAPKGNLYQLKSLNTHHPHLSVMISIGGWTQSGNFHDVAAKRDNRELFATSVVGYLRQ
ncbi:MAG: glycosyl hydrolase family 18, partial [Candidatus Competibacteraceae bacterium]|nr:glycosyl hydrolase family 18 [Candidatus Competibacteraceae bacterium]